MLPAKLVPRFVLVLYGLVDLGIAAGSLNVDGVETTHVGLLHGDPVLEGETLWTLQDGFILYLGVVEFVLVVFAADIGQEVFP